MSLSQLPPERQEFILNQPALEPPDGRVPNFEHPPNQNALFLSVGIVCLCLSSIACIVRAYSNLVKVRQVKLEDGQQIIPYLIMPHNSEGPLISADTVNM